MSHRSTQHLSADDLDAIAAEFDAIHRQVRSDLGPRDARYIRRVIGCQRALGFTGRCVLSVSRHRPAFVAGSLMLAVSKILENMEIGHNVMHGQWDWMRDPAISSSKWEWDAASPAKTWKCAHNFQHHTFTNVLGMDRDLGYSAMRVDPEQPWHPIYLLQPVYGVGIALWFDWGIALYDLDLGAVRGGNKSRAEARADLVAVGRKLCRQLGKDYVVFPLLSSSGSRKSTLKANLVANMVRNVWAQTITFCGHFPDDAETFSREEFDNESRGGRYVRQLVGSCNLDGRPVFHVLTGHLSYQIEHHLFPAVPSNRYVEIAPQVRAVCERYGLPYSSGPLRRQYSSVVKNILKLSLPPRASRRTLKGLIAGVLA